MHPRTTFFASLALALVMVVQPAAALAVGDDQLKQLEEVREQRALYNRQADDLKKQADTSDGAIRDIGAELEKHRVEVLARNQQLELLNQRYAAVKKQRGKAMLEFYKTEKDFSWLYAIASAGSLGDFIKKGTYTDFILKRKLGALEKADTAVKDLDRARRDLLTQQNGLEVRIADLQKQINDIKARQVANADADAAAAALEASLASLTGFYDQNDLHPWLKNNQPVGEQVTFIGSGTEHGLGLSQYGAKGFAARGMKYREIIKHYYKGTEITTMSDNPQVNVGGDMESYLVGVVEAEMNSNWPMEALKAQAIVARSYAYINRGRLDNSPRTQAWVGPSLQTENARRAVADTRGQVVTYGGQVQAAYFHSTSGGHTEHNENVWGGQALSWLRGAASPYEADSPHWEWRTKTYSKQQMADILNKDSRTRVGQLQTIKVLGRGVSGRVTSIQVIGSEGNKTVSGPTFKTIFNVHSPADERGLRNTLFAFI